MKSDKYVLVKKTIRKRKEYNLGVQEFKRLNTGRVNEIRTGIYLSK